MLLCFWSPKGGSGTSVVAASAALLLARHGPTRLADLDGDQPALLGLASDPPTGLADWLVASPDAPTDALERLAVAVSPDLVLLPRGAPLGTPGVERGAALAALLRGDARAAVVDAGAGPSGCPALGALVAGADVSVVVVRGCYVALRRAVRVAELAAATGVVLVDEPGRALGAREVADVLGLPVLATVPVRAAISRVVDAGVLPSRIPDALARPLDRALGRFGLPGRTGQVA
jgi:MinD superfamily P-loop ATPase